MINFLCCLSWSSEYSNGDQMKTTDCQLTCFSPSHIFNSPLATFDSAREWKFESGPKSER